MTFTDNSQGGRTPKVEAAKEAKGFTRITYVPDFEKLGMAGIDDDNLAMLRARVFEVAATNTHLKVYWNGTRIMTRSFKDYIEMFTGTDGEYAFDDGESFKVGVAKSEDGFQHTSFVNTSRTKIGGTHVQYIVNQIVEGLRTHIEKKAKVSVKPSDIRNHLHLFIDATIVNPRYSSQTKDELITEPSAYGRGWSCPDKLIQKLLKTSVIQSVLDWVEAKQLAEKNKALRDAAKGADKSDPRRIEKFSDAAERHQRVKCVLFLSEGDTIFEDEELFIYRDGSFIKIKIKDVRLGDLVLTHLNRLKPVLDISRKVIEGVSIRTKYGDLIVSPEHKLIVYEVDSRQFKNVRAKNLSASNHKLVRSRAIEASLGKFTVTGSGDCKLSIKLDIEQYGELFVSKTHKIYVWNTDGYFEFVECQHLNPAKHLITLKNELSV
jgi:DNA topoisomerase-2